MEIVIIALAAAFLLGGKPGVKKPPPPPPPPPPPSNPPSEPDTTIQWPKIDLPDLGDVGKTLADIGTIVVAAKVGADLGKKYGEVLTDVDEGFNMGRDDTQKSTIIDLATLGGLGAGAGVGVGIVSVGVSATIGVAAIWAVPVVVVIAAVANMYVSIDNLSQEEERDANQREYDRLMAEDRYQEAWEFREAIIAKHRARETGRWVPVPALAMPRMPLSYGQESWDWKPLNVPITLGMPDGGQWKGTASEAFHSAGPGGPPLINGTVDAVIAAMPWLWGGDERYLAMWQGQFHWKSPEELAAMRASRAAAAEAVRQEEAARVAEQAALFDTYVAASNTVDPNTGALTQSAMDAQGAAYEANAAVVEAQREARVASKPLLGRKVEWESQ